MKNFKLNNTLSFIIVIVFLFLVLYVIKMPVKQGFKDVLVQENLNIGSTDISKDKSEELSEDEFMNLEAKWAYANNGIPLGWVKWEDTLDNQILEKFGPVMGGESYVVIVSTSLISKLGIDAYKDCMGDSEIARCAVGSNPEVLRYMKVYNYFY